MQCLVLVRDDFWMALSRFLRTLEIDLSSDRNMMAVDLFNRRHARACWRRLAAAMAACPRTPMRSPTNKRSSSTRRSTDWLEDDRVICVRLALFAEMFKDRPWTPSGLRKLGGIQGVGVAFLKAKLGSEATHPVLSLHRSSGPHHP